jgi:hypothetical protein
MAALCPISGCFGSGSGCFGSGTDRSRAATSCTREALRSESSQQPLLRGPERDIVNLMTKLTTISVTVEQHEQLKEMASADGIAMWELVARFLRRERRRRIGQMLIETNANLTTEERLFESEVVDTGRRSVRDALR